jgi:putative tricarboxylic transport membrane protein
MNRFWTLGASTFAAALLTAGCVQQGDGGGATADAGFEPPAKATMVVPFGPGGGSDVAGRTIAKGIEAAEEKLNVSVENREGGSGAVGYSYFLGENGNEKLLLASETSLIALPAQGNVDFTYQDFTPIFKLGEDFTLLVVHPDSEFKSCSDVVDKAKNGRVLAGVTAQTGLDNIVFTLTERETGASFDRVPFESGGEVAAALLGGQIDIGSLNPSEVIGQLKAGELKALCVFAPERYEYDAVDDIPTAEEQGIPVSFAQFRGVIAPGGISDEAREYWIDVMERVAEGDVYQQYVEQNYLQPITASGDEFVDYLEESTEKLKVVMDSQQ